MTCAKSIVFNLLFFVRKCQEGRTEFGPINKKHNNNSRQNIPPAVTNNYCKGLTSYSNVNSP